MYQKNKLGIRIYKENINIIEGIHFGINSICCGRFNYRSARIRYIKHKIYGIRMLLLPKINKL